MSRLGDELETVWTATEGWPLGVALAAGSERPLAIRPPRAGALDTYLAEELLDPMEPRLRDAVIDSSVAPELDPSLVRALGLPEDFLGEVRRRGVPLRAPIVDDERLAYHPLVRELLSARLVRDRPAARRSQLHAVVAEAMEAEDRGPEGIEHWLAAGRHDRASALVARHGETLLATAPATVGRWLEQLPADARTAPGLRLLEGRLADAAGRLEDAEAPLRDAVDGYARSGDDERAWLARAALAYSYLVRQRFEPAVRLADGYASSSAVAAPMVALMAAAALGGAGSYREASELFADAAARSAGGPLAPLAPGLHGFFVDLPCGRLDAALAGVRETVAQLERVDPFGQLPQVLGMGAAIHDYRGEPDDAIACFVRAAHVSQRTAFDGYVTHFGHVFRASLHARNGRLVEAELALSRTSARLPGWFASDADVTRATIAAGRGDYDALERAIESAALVPWTPRVPCHRSPDPRAGRRRPPRSCPRRGGRRPRGPSGPGLGRSPARPARVAPEPGRRRGRARSPTSGARGRTRATALGISCAASARGSSRCCGRRSSVVSWRRSASSKRWMPPGPAVPPRWP